MDGSAGAGHDGESLMLEKRYFRLKVLEVHIKDMKELAGHSPGKSISLFHPSYSP